MKPQDLNELLITAKVNEYFNKKKVTQSKINQLKGALLNFYTQALLEIKDGEIKDSGNLLSVACEKIMQIMNLQINFDVLPKNIGNFICISNHLPFSKSCKITSSLISKSYYEKTKIKIELPELLNNDSFLLLLSPVISTLQKAFKSEDYSFIIVTTDFREPYNTIIKFCNGIIIDREGNGNYIKLKNQLIEKIAKNEKNAKKTGIILFPENGSSGKKTKQTPFSLNSFKSGFIYLSKEMNLPIVPLIQIFNRDYSISTKILKTVMNEEFVDNKKEFESQMQNEINNERENHFKIVFVSGLDRVGKSTVGGVFESNGYIVFELSSIVRRQFKLQNEFSNVSDFYSTNINTLNESIYNETTNEIFNLNSEKVALIGLRSFELYNLFSNTFSNTSILYINSNQNIRFKRFKDNIKLRPNELDKSHNDFTLNDEMQNSWGLDKIKNIANLEIENNGSKEIFIKKIDNLILKLNEL